MKTLLKLARQSLIIMVLSICFLAQTSTPHAHAAVEPLKGACDGIGSPGYSSKFCKNAAQEKSRNLTSGPGSLLMTIAKTIVILTGSISVIMVVIGGFKYAISTGDPAGTKSAKDTILYALVGLLIAIFAQVLVSLVLSRV